MHTSDNNTWEPGYGLSKLGRRISAAKSFVIALDRQNAVYVAASSKTTDLHPTYMPEICPGGNKILSLETAL